MICSYLRHIDITAVYRDIFSYDANLADGPLANIHPGYIPAAILFELRAEPWRAFTAKGHNG